MKKLSYILIAAIAAAMVLGCAKEYDDSINSVSTKKVSLIFQGGFASTKLAYTESDGSAYDLVWSSGDAIGIFSYDMTYTSNMNVKANILANTVGSTNGIFIPEEDVTIVDSVETTVTIEYPESGSETFFIYYPYADGTDIDVDDLCIYGEIEELQTQDAISDQQVGKNGFSYAFATVTGDEQQVNFTLSHAMAYIRFVVSTSEFADYQLHSIQLYDNNGEAEIAGEFAFDPESCTVSPVTGSTVSSAKVTVDEDDFTASTSSGQELYLTLLPGDYSSADFMVVVTYIDSEGSTVNIPMSLGKTLNLSAGNLYTIELSNVSSSSNTCAWYEPIEARNLLDGWCYGSQNTYFVESKASGEGLTELTIDVKARGDFSKVVEPKYFGFLCAADMSTRYLLQLENGIQAYESIPSSSVNSDYTITVYCKDQSEATGRWASVAIYDEDYNIIWSFMIMRYQTGDEPGYVEYPSVGYQLLDRVLGMGNSLQYSADAASIENSWAYFQWGRKDPFMWSNSGLSHYDGTNVTPSVDIAYSIAHPTIMFSYTSGTDSDGNAWSSNGDWKVDEHRYDLWGTNNTSGNAWDTSLIGEKTIYDPCPEGYRVCDVSVLSRVEAAADSLVAGADGNPFSNTSVLRYSLGNDTYDYWPWGGAHWGSSGAWGNRTTSNNVAGYLYWSNSTGSSKGNAACLVGCNYSTGWNTNTTSNKAQGFTIRCQVDEYGK